MPPAPPRPRWPAALAWAAGLALSGLLSAMSARPPPHPPSPALPEPLPRPLTAAEAAALEAARAQLVAELTAAKARLGRWPRVEELEGPGPDGAPLLPSGVPDNPAAEAVGWVIAGCGPPHQVEPPADWRWCAEDGALVALGLSTDQDPKR